MMKICGVYKITNTDTGGFYIGSSSDVVKRWRDHKQPNVWNRHTHNKMYQYMKNVSFRVFTFEVLEQCSKEVLKEREQYYIEMLKPTYNTNYAFGSNPNKTDKVTQKLLCKYNNEILTLSALYKRFRRNHVEDARKKAKEYLIDVAV